MKLIFSLFLCFIFGNLFCQIVILDDFNTPIPSVKIYSKKLTFLTQSDKSGIVEWSKIENLILMDTLYLRHSNYKTKWILRKDIKMNDTIVLYNKVQELPEYNVTTSKINYTFQTIHACYRSYQLNDDSLIYYTDGLVDYLNKTNKMKYQKMLKEYRSYTDSIYINDIKKRNYMMVFKIARIPPPLTEYIPEKYINRNKLTINQQADGAIYILTKNKIKIGTIKKDSNFVTFFISDIFSNKLRKSPKYEASQLSSEITLIFKINENDSNFIISNFDHLVYSKIYRKYDFKHKADKKFTKIENVEEIFVESIQYANEVEIDKYDNRFGFPKESNYQTDFWEKCKCKLYSIPPYSL